jgi:nucleoside-diphosphate-sugar epimerase
MTGVDGVFHVAGWYKVGVRDKRPGRAINVDGTRNVLELMKELRVPKGVYTSTLAVNSNTHGQLRDESYRFTGKHLSTYDKTKAEAHDIAAQFISEGLPLVILMPGMIYGPDGTALSDHSWRLYLRKKLPMIVSKTAYCYGHVDDMADAHITAMEIAKPGSTYIIAGPPHKLTEAFDIARKITGIRKPMVVPPWFMRLSSMLVWPIDKLVRLPELYTSEAMRVIAGVTYLGDNSKAKRELRFNPRPLEVGLKETLEYEREKLRRSQS